MQQAATKFVDGRLYSLQHDDFYAARDAVAEVHEVHAEPSNFADRVQDAKTFTVFELGLGAGINFLVLSEIFLAHSSQDSRLRFTTCEANPLPVAVLRETLRRTTPKLTLADEFINQYPPPMAGIHRRLFRSGRIELTILYCDVDHAINEFTQHDEVGVDAWILDGFAPNRNPAMWEDQLIARLAQRTKAGGTATTFSVAGNVRRALESHGFSVDKMPGKQGKRHTLVAQLSTAPFEPASIPLSVLVVGGGFAGCATALALARRGVHVELRTPSGSVADATSAIPVAIVHGRLSASDDYSAHIRRHAHVYSQSLTSSFSVIHRSGAIQFPNERMSRERLEGIVELLGESWSKWCSPGELKEVTGFDADSEAVYFPRSFTVDGSQLCNEFLAHSGIERSARLYESIDDSTSTVVIATGNHQVLGEAGSFLEIAQLEGQIDTFDIVESQRMPRVALLHEGYIAPSDIGLTAGSTYEYQTWPRGQATQRNLQRIVELVGDFGWIHKTAFRGNRATTSDKLPVAGQLKSGIWLNLGHGSSGTTSAPFCGEIVASLITHELPPLFSTALRQLAPQRFLERQKRRPNPFLKRRSLRADQGVDR